MKNSSAQTPLPKKHQKSFGFTRKAAGFVTRIVTAKQSAAMAQRTRIAPSASMPIVASVRVKKPIVPQRQPAARTARTYFFIESPNNYFNCRSMVCQ